MTTILFSIAFALLILVAGKIVYDVIRPGGDPKGDPTPPEFRPSQYAGPAAPVSPEDREVPLIRDDRQIPLESRRRDDLGYFDGR